MANTTQPYQHRNLYSPRPFTPEDAAIAISQIAKDKGKERAALIERMMRWETAHFQSKQYIATGTGGMEDGAWGKALKPYFPNGYQLAFFKDNHPKERGTSRPLGFIIWPSVYQFVQFLSDYIDRHNSNYAAWNSTQPARQEKYRRDIATVKSSFVTGIETILHNGEDELKLLKEKALTHPKTTVTIGAGTFVAIALIGWYLLDNKQ